MLCEVTNGIASALPTAACSLTVSRDDGGANSPPLKKHRADINGEHKNDSLELTLLQYLDTDAVMKEFCSTVRTETRSKPQHGATAIFVLFNSDVSTQSPCTANLLKESAESSTTLGLCDILPRFVDAPRCPDGVAWLTNLVEKHGARTEGGDENHFSLTWHPDPLLVMVRFPPFSGPAEEFSWDLDGVELWMAKNVATTQPILSAALVSPVFSMWHLLAQMRDAFRNTTAGRCYFLLWLSASWCAPCQRILADLPSMRRESFPPTIRGFAKADWDQVHKSVFVPLGVETIPTFVVFDCAKAEEIAAESEDGAVRAVLRAKVAALQSSQRSSVETFLDCHCMDIFASIDEF
jgi:thiol-disulfide isomerase/thioredoxin